MQRLAHWFNRAGECVDELVGVEALVTVDIESNKDLEDRVRELKGKRV